MDKILMIVIGLLILLIAIFLGSALLLPIISGPFDPSAKCLYNAHAIIWEDKNKNGIKEDDETPLSGVKLHFRGLIKSQTLATESISNLKGEVLIAIWSNECRPLSFDMIIETPTGFSPTTPSFYHINYSEGIIGNVKSETFWKGKDYYFGLYSTNQ